MSNIDLNTIDIYDKQLIKEITANMDKDEKKKFMKSINNKKYFIKNQDQIRERYKDKRVTWLKNKRETDLEYRAKINENARLYKKKQNEMLDFYKNHYLVLLEKLKIEE